MEQFDLVGRQLSKEQPLKCRGDKEEHLVVPDQREAVVHVGSHPVLASGTASTLLARAKDVAALPVSVLIQGETGTGKEWVARSLHHYGRNPKASFRAINCASIPRPLLESTLLGAERGSYTGATKTTAGVFEQAGHGTVLLDEIGELPLESQAALLRVLDGYPYSRVGGGEDLSLRARVVAATNRPLPELVRAGTFRADLYYRLSTIYIEVPPLRERKDEIFGLASAFIERARKSFDHKVTRMSSEYLAALEGYSWPGNIRQLRNVVEASVARCDGNVLTRRELPPGPLSHPTGSVYEERSAPDPSASSYRLQVREFEVSLIEAALKRCNGNQKQAAELLRLPHRTLVHKIQTFGLKRKPTMHGRPERSELLRER